MSEMDLAAAESKATYEEIKSYVLEHTGLKVSNLYIAQIKKKCDIIERANYNLPKSENSRQPKCSGNVIEKGNVLDCWYPLLPRRISDKDVNPFDTDGESKESEDDGYDDIFDTCPDCGCGISLRNDGGNGFCIDCAWNH